MMLSLIKKLLIVTLVFCSTATLADGKSRSVEQIVKSGQLRIAVSVFPPWVMRAKDGQLIGSEIDMGRRLAADMGVAPKFSEYEWKQLIPALNRGEVDIIISGMAIKPDRALKVNFSRPYGDSGIGLAANTQLTKDFESLDELQKPGVNIAAMEGTVSAELAKRMFASATLKTFSNESKLEEALLKGKVHAVIASNPLPKFVALKYPGKVDLPLQSDLLSFREGMAINKGDYDFLNFIDSWIIARTADAWIPTTRKYWLESLEWKDQVN